MIDLDQRTLNKIKEFYSTNPSTVEQYRFEMLTTGIRSYFDEFSKLSSVANYWNELIKTKLFNEESLQTILETPHLIKHVYQGQNALMDTLRENLTSIPDYLYDQATWLINKFPLTQLVNEKYSDAYKSAALIKGLRVHAPEKLVKAVEHIAKNTLFDLYKEDSFFVAALLNTFEKPNYPLPKSLVMECLRGIAENFDDSPILQAQARALQLKIKADGIIASDKFPSLAIANSL